MKEYAALLIVLGTLACAGRNQEAGAQTAGADTLAGTWVLDVSAPSRPRPGPGLRLAITIDSVRGTALFGRVTHFMSGDVGLDPSALAPFSGTTTADGQVRIDVPWGRDDALGLLLEGQLRGDTIRLDLLQIGPDTLPRAQWALIRTRR